MYTVATAHGEGPSLGLRRIQLACIPRVRIPVNGFTVSRESMVRVDSERPQFRTEARIYSILRWRMKSSLTIMHQSLQQWRSTTLSKI